MIWELAGIVLGLVAAFALVGAEAKSRRQEMDAEDENREA